MGRYNFVSPGAAAGDSIVDVLAKARAEDRQRMIDQITSQNAESQRALESEQIQASQTGRFNKEFEDTAKGWQLNQDLSGVDPRYLAEGKKRGWIGKKPKGSTPVVSTEQTFGGAAGPLDVPIEPGAEQVQDQSPSSPTGPQQQAPEGDNFYRGDRAQQEDEQSKNDIGSIISGLMADDKMPADQKQSIINALMIMQTTGGKSMPAWLGQVMQPQEPNHLFDVESGKFSDAPGHGGQIITRPREPRVPRDTGSYVGPATDKAGKTVPGKAVVFQNGSLRVIDIPVSGIGPKPSSAGGGKKDIPTAAEWNNLSKLHGKAVPTSTMWGYGPDKAPANEDVAAYNQQLMNIMSRVDAPMEIIMGVMEVLEKYQDTPTQDLINAQEEAGNSPEDVQKFARLLMQARGQIQ